MSSQNALKILINKIFEFNIAVLRRIAHNTSPTACAELSVLFPHDAFMNMKSHVKTYGWDISVIRANYYYLRMHMVYKLRQTTLKIETVVEYSTLFFINYLHKILTYIEYKCHGATCIDDVNREYRKMTGVTITEFRALINAYSTVLDTTFRINKQVSTLHPTCPMRLQQFLTDIDNIVHRTI